MFSMERRFPLQWQRSCRVRKETGSQVLGFGNKEWRVDSGSYRVREAAGTTLQNCVVRAGSALTLSVLSWVRA